MSDKKLKFLILPAGGSRRSSSIPMACHLSHFHWITSVPFALKLLFFLKGKLINDKELYSRIKQTQHTVCPLNSGEEAL